MLHLDIFGVLKQPFPCLNMLAKNSGHGGIWSFTKAMKFHYKCARHKVSNVRLDWVHFFQKFELTLALIKKHNNLQMDR